MAVAKWSALGTLSTDIAGTALNSLASAAHSALLTYDNSTNLDLYALVLLNLGSFTSLAGANVILRTYPTIGANVPDNTASVGGGEIYTQPLTVGASAKVAIFNIRLFPSSMRLQITNQAGAAFAASANTLKLAPYNETVT
jgi:hypothetical protein